MSKTKLFFLGFSFLLTTAFGQAIYEPNLLVLGRIPLQMHIYGQFIQPLDDMHLKLSPGKLVIKPLHPDQQIFASTLWMPKDDLNIPINPHKILMGLYEYDSLLSELYPICKHADSLNCHLNDTGLVVWLMPGRHYQLNFLDHSLDKQLYSLNLIAINEMPALETWWADEVLHSAHLDKKIEIPKPIQIPHTNKALEVKQPEIVVAKPGSIILNYRKPYPWADSLFEFSWLRAANMDASGWQKASNSFAIPAIRHQPTEVAVRYSASDTANKIMVKVAPRWFDFFWVKVLIGLLTTFMLGLGYHYIIQYRDKQLEQYRNQLTSELLNLQKKVPSHFIVNALQTLHMLLDNKHFKQAKRFSEALSTLLRDSIQQQQQPLYQSLADCITQLNHYIELHQMMLGFSYDFTVSPALNLQQAEVPNDIFLPVVENAIKYNLIKKGSTLNILIYQKGSSLMVDINAHKNVEDDASHLYTPVSTGLGLYILSKRLDIHNQLFPAKPITFTTQFTNEASRVIFNLQNYS